MAAFQRIILLLIAICAVVSVSAAPIKAVQVRQQSLHEDILSDDKFSDVVPLSEDLKHHRPGLAVCTKG